jgi:hypothetical protein
MTTHAAPSLMDEALAAVIVPFSSNEGFRSGTFFSSSLPGPSSFDTRIGSPFFWGTGTGTISSLNPPDFWASCAFLKLEEPEEPFHGGIDMVVQFPNKPSIVVSGASGGDFLPGADYHCSRIPTSWLDFGTIRTAFSDAVKPPAVLDEIQNVPEVFNYVRARIDRSPRRTGQWF